MTTTDNKGTLEAVFQVLQDSQRVTERTGNLVENVLKDIGRLREQSEGLAVMKSRLDNIERVLEERNRECGTCSKELEGKITLLDQKREANKDKIAEVESFLLTRMETMREVAETKRTVLEADLKERIAKHEREADNKFTTMQKSIDQAKLDMQKELDSKNLTVTTEVAKQGGKYGAYVSLIVSLVFMLITWLVQHISHTPKP